MSSTSIRKRALDMVFSQKRLHWIGPFIGVLYMTAPLVGMIGYAMGAVTMYTVVMPYIKPVFPWLTLPLFFVILLVAGSLLLVLFYKFVYPSYYAFLNKQVYVHDNPIQRDLSMIKDKLGIR